MVGMVNKELRDRERIEAVLQILRKQTPLSVKQEKFCTDACVERFLKAKGDSMKKASKLLRACLSWRDAIGIEHLIADEFTAELADGVAYVAGHDDDDRPVVVFRIKQDYHKFHSPKSFLRLVVFTLEVAISSMSRFVEQFVLLFDASFFRSASAFLNMYIGTLKIISDYYPGRLHKSFVIDPPALFSYLWKGARPFVDLWSSTAVVSSLDFEDSLEDESFTSYPRTASLRFDPVAAAATIQASKRGGGSTSSRFSFTVSHMDSLKPWYLTRTEVSATTNTAPTASPSLVGVSPLNARSLSFASPAARSTPRFGVRGLVGSNINIPSTPSQPPRPGQHPPRTPRPSFLQSPSMLFFGGGQREGQQMSSRSERGRESFLPFLRFYRRPYDEMVYRSKMRPPFGGLVSIVSAHGVKHHRRHVTHQNF